MTDVEKIKLTMSPEKKTLDKIWNWLITAVSPSLKLFVELGKAEDKDYLQMLLEGAEVNETQQRMYEDYIKTHRLAERERSVKRDRQNGHSTDNTI